MSITVKEPATTHFAGDTSIVTISSRLKAHDPEMMTMSTAQIERRLEALEKAVKSLEQQFKRAVGPTGRWWVEHAGRFANDPDFEDIVRLGREYRKSQRPAQRKSKRDHKQASNFPLPQHLALAVAMNATASANDKNIQGHPGSVSVDVSNRQCDQRSLDG
jgi:hypothetical protein